jgi:hypothetical protein
MESLVVGTSSNIDVDVVDLRSSGTSVLFEGYDDCDVAAWSKVGLGEGVPVMN